MHEVNGSVFDGGRRETWWRRIAGGFQLDRNGNHVMGADGCVERNGGIHMIQNASLKVGHTYFRFFDAIRSRDPARGARHVWGAWWIDQKTLDYVVEAARRSDQYLNELMKAKLAVPYEWGAGDMILVATVVKPLRVMMGYGNKADVHQPGAPGAHPADRGIGYTPTSEFMQIFIPGLTPEIAGQAFRQDYRGYLRRYVPITSRCKVL